jgi:hypothetical protein
VDLLHKQLFSPVISFVEVQLIIAETATSNSAKLTALNSVRSHNASKFSSTYDAYVEADFQTGGIVNKGLSSADAMKMEILLEKFCSVIGLPTYQDVLRTDNFINVPIKSSNTTMIPQRFIYPSSEEASNANFPGYVDQFEATPIHN